MAYTMVTTATPKAKAMPKTPMPSPGRPALSSALPQPANTNQKVPSASAARRRPIVSPLPVDSGSHYAVGRAKVQAGKGPDDGQRGLTVGRPTPD